MTRDRSASQRGISMILVVIVVVITIILTVTSLLLYGRLQHLQNVQKELIDIKKLEMARNQALVDRARVNLEATGLRGSEDLKELGDTRPREELKNRAEKAFAPMDEKLKVYPPDKQEELKKKEEALQKASLEYGIYPTLQELVRVAAGRLLYVKNLNDQLKLQVQIAENHAKAVAEMKQPVTQRKTDYIAHLTAEIAEVNKRIQAEDEAYNARNQELTAAKAAAEQGLTDETARFYEWEIKIKNDIREKQRQLEELKIKEAIKFEINTVHGRVVKPDVPNKMAFIDIGSRDRVVAGLKFIAAKRGPQGRFVYKAELEVKKVWPTWSEVSIVKVLDDEVPVIDGDFIINPLFHKRRPIVVAFAGVEQPAKIRPAWSTNEATRRIREIGSEVRANVTPDVDFLIFTEVESQKQHIAYPNYVKAVTLGVPYEEAAEIFRFLGD